MMEMMMSAPSETQIQTTDTSVMVVDYDDFFVMTPKFDGVLGSDVVWVPHALDVMSARWV